MKRSVLGKECSLRHLELMSCAPTVLLLLLMQSCSGLLQLSTGETFTSLTSALISSNSSLQVLFLDSESYQMTTFGSHSSLALICQNNTLAISAVLLVPSETWVKLTNCQMTSEVTTGALISVFGSVELEGGGVFALKVSAFILYGSLALHNSNFAFNTKSLYVASLFGFSLLIDNCSFEDNSSSAGAILLLSLFGSEASSSTNITIISSQFRRNSAALGGSFLYLNVNKALNLSASQLPQSRTLTVADSHFEANPGILCLITSNSFLDSVFRNDSFTGVQTAFVVKQLSADFTVHASFFRLTNYLVVVSALLAQLTVTEVVVEDITVGPALLIFNSADISLGLVRVSGLTITYCRYISQSFFVTSLRAVNAAVQMERITVRDTVAYGGLGGIYSFSVATVQDVHVQNVTFFGSVVMLFFSQADSSNLFLSNVTLTIGGFHGCYSSTSQMRNLTTDVGLTGYLRKPTPRYNVIVAFDSNVTLLDCHFVVPPIANYPALYLWRSSLFAQNLYFTALYANFLNAFEHSNGTVSNVTIGDFKAQSITLAFNSVVRLDTLTVEQGDIRAGAIVALSQAQVHFTHFTLRQGGLNFLVSAAQSTLHLANFILPALRANTLFTDITHSSIEVTNMSLSDSTLDLTQLYSSQLILRFVSLSNIRIRRRFILLVRANLTFEDCSLYSFSAVTDTPLGQASKDSTLSLFSTQIVGLWSLEQDLMHFSHSALLLRASSLANCNGTFIAGEFSQISIESSTVLNGGPQRKARGNITAGFIECSSCSVTLSNSQFEKISGTRGGVLSLTSSSLSIEACKFFSGAASENGGFVSAVDSNVTIELSRLESGRAIRGGAIFFDCSASCHCLLSATNLSWNSALEGGAVYWTKVRPSYSSLQAPNNTALYGSFEASLPTYMALIAANQAVLYGVAGVNVIQPILIGFFDAIDQLVVTDNSSSAELKSEHLLGTTSVLAKGGVANFSSILLQALPGSSISIQAISESINQTFPNSPHYSFAYVTRLCKPGEVTTAVGCYLCPKNTYSVSPTDSECRECPGYASCPGGKALVLSAGYWRKSDLSVEVFRCPVLEACLGGDNATCAVGYGDVLCARCRDGHYSTGLHYCERCEMLFVRVLRAVLICAAATCIYLVLVALPSEISVAGLRLVVEFFQTLLILPSLNVDWGPLMMRYFSFNEMLMSFGLSALTLDCLLESASLPVVFIKAIIATAFPLLASALLAGACYCGKNRGSFVPRYVRSCIAFLWFYHPYMVKSALILLPCKKENNSWLLAADVSVSCYTPEQRFLLAVTVPTVLVSVVPFPFLLWRVMADRKYVPAFLIAYNRLKCIAPLRAVFCRIAVFAVLLGLSFAGYIEQILCSASVLYICLQMHVTTPQYTSRFLEVAEGASWLVQTYLCACGLYFAVELEVNSTVKVALSSLLLLLVFLLVVCICVIGLKLQRSQIVHPTTANLESGGLVSVAPPPSMASQQSISVDSLCQPN